MKIISEKNVQAQHVNFGACVLYINHYYLLLDTDDKDIKLAGLDNGCIITISPETEVIVINAEVVIK